MTAFPLLGGPIADLLKKLAGPFLSGLERGKLTAAFAKAAPAVVTRLEKDGVTVEKVGSRQVIRAAEYLLWKMALQSSGVSKGANVLGDAIRDRHDERVIAIVEPKLTPSTTLVQLVALVAAAEVEVTF